MGRKADLKKEPFRYMVQLLIERNEATIINNENQEHAKVLLEEMFYNSTSTAYVFCGCISEIVWGGDKLAEAVRDAFARGVDVKFMVQHPSRIPANSPVAAVLREHNAILSSNAFDSLSSHFAVFDSKMYRFEKDDTKKKATACMNGVETATLLHGLAKDMIARAVA